MTDRQFRAWCKWLDMQWDRPSRTDHYLMQIAAALCEGKSTPDMKLPPFERVRPAQSELAVKSDREIQMARARERSNGRVRVERSRAATADSSYDG